MRPFDVLGCIKSYMSANTWEKQVDLRTSLILIMICWGCVDFLRFPKQPRKAITGRGLTGYVRQTPHMKD